MILVCLGAVAAAQPYVPTSDDEVIERLPPGLRSSELRQQRNELATDPENIRDSVMLAESYLEMSSAEGDARFVGYAQAILSPWWELERPPVPVQVVRARIRMASWEYDRAIADLDSVLRSEPTHAPALLTRLKLELARGQVDAAAKTLEQVRPLVPALTAAVAAARVERVSGQASAAYDALERALAMPPSTSQDEGAGAVERREARGLLADIALQLGRREAALEHFKTAAQTGPRDLTLLIAHADALLDDSQPEAVLKLLSEVTQTDAVRIRMAEALQNQQGTGTNSAPANGAETMIQILTKNLEARQRRGDATVLEDEVRFQLRVLRDPTVALQRARELWSVRRELSDVRLVLEAALLAGEPAAARRVTEWARTNRVEDARLTPRRVPTTSTR